MLFESAPLHKPQPKFGWSQTIADDLTLRQQVVSEAPKVKIEPCLNDFEDIVVFRSESYEESPQQKYCGISSHTMGNGVSFMEWYQENRMSRTTEERELELDNEAIQAQRERTHEWAREIHRNREPWDKRDLNTIMQEWAGSLTWAQPEHVPIGHFGLWLEEEEAPVT